MSDFSFIVLVKDQEPDKVMQGMIRFLDIYYSFKEKPTENTIVHE